MPCPPLSPRFRSSDSGILPWTTTPLPPYAAVVGLPSSGSARPGESGTLPSHLRFSPTGLFRLLNTSSSSLGQDLARGGHSARNTPSPAVGMFASFSSFTAWPPVTSSGGLSRPPYISTCPLLFAALLHFLALTMTCDFKHGFTCLPSPSLYCILPENLD